MEHWRSYQRIEGAWRRTIVVGDIHGCAAEFEELCRAVKLEPPDLLVTAGDFLARGPASWQVARFLRDRRNCHSVLGNHELKVAGAIRGTVQKGWSHRQALSTLDREEWAEWGAFLECLPAVIETPHAIVTHARLDPCLPLGEQDHCFTAAYGDPAPWIDLDDDGVPLWFYQISVAKPLCIGHIGYSDVELVTGKLYAVDTRAVRGGMLTAVDFPTGRITQVPAKRNYFDEAARAWKAREP